jgi:hypothetical protein
MVQLVSDHYPVRATISIDFSKNHDKPLEQRQKTVSKVNWNRIDKNLYQQEIEKQLDNLCIDNYAEIHLDKAYYDINSLIESAVSTVAPSSKITRKKPKLNVMNSDIYNAIKEKKQAYCIWKWNGKPQNPLDQLVINKKLTSYNLRRFCRMEVAQKRIKERQELIEAKTMDNKLFHNVFVFSVNSVKIIMVKIHSVRFFC